VSSDVDLNCLRSSTLPNRHPNRHNLIQASPIAHCHYNIVLRTVQHNGRSIRQRSVRLTTITRTNAQLTLIPPTSDLLRRLNPKHTARNLSGICSLVPQHEEELLASVDQPLTAKRCAKTGRDYLLCDYNRDGDSYRSPWSNEFEPPLDDAEYPSDRVRKMEVRVNEAFDVYREL